MQKRFQKVYVTSKVNEPSYNCVWSVFLPYQCDDGILRELASATICNNVTMIIPAKEKAQTERLESFVQPAPCYWSLNVSVFHGQVPMQLIEDATDSVFMFLNNSITDMAQLYKQFIGMKMDTEDELNSRQETTISTSDCVFELSIKIGYYPLSNNTLNMLLLNKAKVAVQQASMYFQQVFQSISQQI